MAGGTCHNLDQNSIPLDGIDLLISVAVEANRKICNRRRWICVRWRDTYVKAKGKQLKCLRVKSRFSKSINKIFKQTLPSFSS